MSIKKLKIVSLVLLIVTLFSGGCSSLRRGTGTEFGKNDLRNAVLKHLDASDKNDYVLIQNASLSLSAGRKVSSKLIFYAERDVQIFASIRFLGFEVGRMQITKDSIKLINRIEREYYFESISKLGLPSLDLISYDVLQNIIFTGFWDVPRSKNNSFYNKAVIRRDNVSYEIKPDLYTGIIFNYSVPEINLARAEYKDLNASVRALFSIERSMGEIYLMRGQVQKELFVADFELEIDEILNRSYSKTDFRIGRNYTEISKLF